MMARFALRSLVAASFVALGAVIASSSASAGTVDGAGFGQHVSDCTQSMGFDKFHNPGMHQGISMWDPSHTC